MCDIYQYLDYTKWLTDEFKCRKAQAAMFSHRYIAQRLGLKSSGYILYVMQGKRRLTEAMAIELAQVFKLPKAPMNYFLQLIRYTHAKSSSEKQFHFQRLVTLRQKSVKTVEPQQYRFYEKWYYPVIREIIAFSDIADDAAAIASMTVPHITAAEAREALTVLTNLGLIEQSGDGVYRKCSAVISTGDTWHSAIIHEHQRELLERGREALDTVAKADRDISHLTITASEGTLELISQRIAHLRTEILELARLEKNPDRVLQCNFMVFPTGQKNGAQNEK